MGLLTPVNLDMMGQAQPYFLYEKRFIHFPIERFFWRIDYGFGYLLRRVVISWPYTLIANGGFPTPELYAQFFDSGTGKARQVDPIPVSLFSSPASFSEKSPTANFPAPDMRVGCGVRGSFKILNWYYPYGDTIELRITGQDTIGAQHCGQINPPYVRVMLDGYYVPEKSLEMWDKPANVEGVAA